DRLASAATGERPASTLDMGAGLQAVGSQMGIGRTGTGASSSTAVTSTFDSRFGGSTAVTPSLAPPGALAGRQAGAAGQATTFELPGIRITADIVNNSLVIYANQEHYRLIEQTLNQLDRPQLQVAIHATIAEITLNNELRY